MDPRLDIDHELLTEVGLLRASPKRIGLWCSLKRKFYRNNQIENKEILLAEQNNFPFKDKPCNNNNIQEKSEPESDNNNTDGEISLFWRIHSEIRIHIFEYLPQSDLLSCRRVCSKWNSEVDSILELQCFLSQEKLKTFPGLKVFVNEFIFENMTEKIGIDSLERLPKPYKVELNGGMYSSNLLKISMAWPQVTELSITSKALNSHHLFRSKTYHKNLMIYFPHVHELQLHLDNLEFKRNIYFERFRSNLTRIALNPFKKLTKFVLQFSNLNSQWQCMQCYFLAHAFLWIGRCAETLQDVEVTYYTEKFSNIHACLHVATEIGLFVVSEEIRIQGQKNLERLALTSLKRCVFRVGSTSLCTTEFRVCNLILELYILQRELEVFILEIRYGGVDFTLVQSVININSSSLTCIDVTVSFNSDYTLALSNFSDCFCLRKLRLIRLDHHRFPPKGISEFSVYSFTISGNGNEGLPENLEFISLRGFHFHLSTVNEILGLLPILQCVYLHENFVDFPADDLVEMELQFLNEIKKHETLTLLHFYPVNPELIKKMFRNINCHMKFQQERSELTNLGWKIDWEFEPQQHNPISFVISKYQDITSHHYEKGVFEAKVF